MLTPSRKGRTEQCYALPLRQIHFALLKYVEAVHNRVVERICLVLSCSVWPGMYLNFTLLLLILRLKRVKESFY